MAKTEELCRAEARAAYDLREEKLLQGFVIAATDHVERPEQAVADPVWWERGGAGGLGLEDLLHPPWRRWHDGVTEEQAREQVRRAYRQAFLADPEAIRSWTQERWKESKAGMLAYHEHLAELNEEQRSALEALLEETSPMTETERRAFGYFQRRTRLDERDEPRELSEEPTLTPDEQAAVEELRRLYLIRQRTSIASLHARYPYLPFAVRSMRRLDQGKLLGQWDRRSRDERIRGELTTLKRVAGRTLDYLAWRSKEVDRRKEWRGRLAPGHHLPG